MPEIINPTVGNAVHTSTVMISVQNTGGGGAAADDDPTNYNGAAAPPPPPQTQAGAESQISEDDQVRTRVVESYESQLRTARRCARAVASLHSICRFLAYCNLTWATVVLLGGFVSNLKSPDFVFVTVLLLLEAARLGFAIFFSKILGKSLIKLSQSPSKFLPKLTDSQPKYGRLLRMTSLILQAFSIIPSIVLPSLRFHLLNQTYPRDADFSPNLLPSLRLFYGLALTNACVGLLAVLASAACLLLMYDPSEHSIQRYFDEILQRSFDGAGVSLADEFDAFDFMIVHVVGNAFSRNVQAPTVKKQHIRFLEYLFWHRHGFDVLEGYIDADYVYARLAAVNIPGFWASMGLPVEKLPISVLNKLGEKLDLGSSQVGWSAFNSVDAIAKKQPCPPALARSNVIRKLNEIDFMPRSSRYLAYLRALITLHGQFTNEMQINDSLVEKVRDSLQNVRRHRMRILAGYLLMKLNKLDEQRDIESIKAIDPTDGDYIFKSELTMLNELMGSFGLPLHTREDIKEKVLKRTNDKEKANNFVREDM